MCKKEFKEKINNNKKIIREKSIITVNLNNNLVAKIDKNNTRADIRDIEANIKEVVSMCSNIRKNQVINLSAFCDCMYDVLFCGCKESELYFKVV